MYHYFEIYPKSEKGKDKELYFIEFLQFFDKDPITWKLYKRQFILPEDEIERLKQSAPNDWELLQIMGNEGHPWWLLDGTLQPDGTVPDKNWLLWMVDALNEKSKKS